MPNQYIETIKVNDLHLWTENPRDPVDVNYTDYEIIQKAIENDGKKWNLPNLVQEMGDYYDFSELPTVVERDGKYIVYDGNRRIAVLKYLQDKKLYASFGGGLFPELEPEELKNLTEIPCNVCDLETALINIERKHVNNGTWGPIEREYFKHQHRGQNKSLFLKFEEQTGGAISKHSKMNQRFVKEEVLTENKLKEIGFGLDKTGNLVSSYSGEDSEDIIQSIISIVEKGQMNTRDNRGKLKDTLLSQNPSLKNKIKTFDPEASMTSVSVSIEEKEKPTRKTKITKPNDAIFGRTLSLKAGKVNDLYRAITTIYDQNKNNRNALLIILPIVGMSLRLILDVAGREHYKDIGDSKTDNDSIYKDFLKKAKKDLNKENENYLSLTDDWLSDKLNIEGVLSKYAHGNINSSKDDTLKTSAVVGDILEKYFTK